MKEKPRGAVFAAFLAASLLAAACAAAPRASGGAAAVAAAVRVPLFEPSLPGYGALSAERKSLALLVSFSLLDWPGAPPALAALLRGLLYEDSAPEDYAARRAAALAARYREAGAALLAEPGDAPSGSFNWRYEETVHEVHDGPGLLVVRRVVDDYSGGAHGFRASGWFVIDKAVPARLRLEDLLAEGAGDSLRRLAAAGLARQGLPEAGFPAGDALAAGFSLDAAGLSLHFAPYETAPYSRGQVTVTLPYGAVWNLLTPRARALADEARGK